MLNVSSQWHLIWIYWIRFKVFSCNDFYYMQIVLYVLWSDWLLNTRKQWRFFLIWTILKETALCVCILWLPKIRLALLCHLWSWCLAITAFIGKITFDTFYAIIESFYYQLSGWWFFFFLLCGSECIIRFWKWVQEERESKATETATATNLESTRGTFFL